MEIDSLSLPIAGLDKNESILLNETLNKENQEPKLANQLYYILSSLADTASLIVQKEEKELEQESAFKAVIEQAATEMRKRISEGHSKGTEGWDLDY